MPLAESLSLFAVALMGGGINAVAGGGSFFTFPALLLVSRVSAIVANATSTVALWPGSVSATYGYRRELWSQRHLLVPLGVVSLLGGVLGALLVLWTPAPLFERLVPFLLLAATLLFTFSAQLREKLERLGRPGLPVVAVAQLAIAVYGGYFGGGMGLVMLAVFALLGPKDLNAMNALKSALGAAINLTALATFIFAGVVDWPRALVMAAGSVAGGFLAAATARRLDARKVRRAVVVFGWALTAAFFVKTFG